MCALDDAMRGADARPLGRRACVRSTHSRRGRGVRERIDEGRLSCGNGRAQRERRGRGERCDTPLGLPSHARRHPVSHHTQGHTPDHPVAPAHAPRPARAPRRARAGVSSGRMDPPAPAPPRPAPPRPAPPAPATRHAGAGAGRPPRPRCGRCPGRERGRRRHAQAGRGIPRAGRWRWRRPRTTARARGCGATACKAAWGMLYHEPRRQEAAIR